MAAKLSPDVGVVLMNRASLVGHSILVVEDEPLIALEIVACLRSAGASVFTTHNLRDALPMADYPDLSAAVLDFGLSDGDAGAVCDRLNARGVPFVLYSGYQHVHPACRNVHEPRPVGSEELVGTVVRLLQ